MKNTDYGLVTNLKSVKSMCLDLCNTNFNSTRTEVHLLWTHAIRSRRRRRHRRCVLMTAVACVRRLVQAANAVVALAVQTVNVAVKRQMCERRRPVVHHFQKSHDVAVCATIVRRPYHRHSRVGINRRDVLRSSKCCGAHSRTQLQSP
jgi:hypothetical protein